MQALHCEDALSGDTTDTWKCYADDRLDPPDLNLLTLLFMSAKKALRRHSIRLSSAEVSNYLKGIIIISDAVC